MTYTLANGKTINIPTAEIEKSMKNLELTKEEAIQMWLEDEGYEENAEQQALEEKGKAVKVSGKAEERKPRKPRERKPNMEKRELIDLLAQFLINRDITDAVVSNPEKTIDFSVGENHYSFSLICHRPPKA